ncbi:MAG: tetratricopeptide repeat protein [Gammaproteobacteria bacterium]
MSMRPLVFLPIIAVTAVLAGCATHAPAPAQKNTDESLSALAQKLHSPQLMAQVLLKQAREKKDPDRATQAAIYAFKAGDDALAGQAADTLAQLQPDSPVPALIHFRVALDKADLPSAEKAAEKLFTAGGARAIYQVSDGDFDDWYVYAVMRKLSAAHPEDAELTQLLAQTALSAGDSDAALAAARKAVAAGLDDLMMQIVQMQAEWDLGQRKAALARGAKVLAAHSHDEVFRALYAGLLIRANDYAHAQSVLDDGAALDPGNLHINLAYVLLEQARGKDKAAHKRLTQLLEHGSTNSSVYYLLGQSAAARGDWSQAFVWYASANDDSSSQVAAAVALRHWKGLDAAQGFLNKLKQHVPGLTPLWIATEASLIDDDGDSDLAYTMLDAAVERYPVVRPLRYQRALLADKLNKPQVALATLKHLIAVEPGNAEYLNAYGYVLTEHTRRYSEAYGYIRHALDAHPDDPAILDSAGWVLYKLGKPEQALGYLKRAHEGVEDATVAVHLATVYLALGRKADADKLIKAALARSPHNADLKRLQQRASQ